MSADDGTGTPPESPEPPREPQAPAASPQDPILDEPERTRVRLPLFQDTARYSAPAPPSADAEATRTRLPRITPGVEATHVGLPPVPPHPAPAPGSPVLPPPPQGWAAVASAAPAPGRPEEPSEAVAGTSRRWLPIVLIGALALVLVVGAYVAGRAFTGGTDSAADKVTATPTPSSSAAPTSAAPTTPAATVTPTPAKKPAPKAYRGKVTAVPVRTIATGCIAPAGVDSAGGKVGYGAANTVDGRPGTAWRCDGAAIGRTLTFYLPRGVRVAELGLIPGYAKTDPRSHADRYAENNRITKVQWTVGRAKVTQTMSGRPKDRRLRTIRIPATRASTVTLRILSVAKGSRNTTMISEVRIARAG